MRFDVHRLSIPNPFFEGRNSIYLIPADPVTLIDSGVATDKAFAALEHGLSELRLSVKDIRRVVLTHKHIDHIGNAWRIQEIADAEILIHHSECKSVTDVDPSGTRFRTLVDAKLAEWNVPADDWPPKNSGMPQWRLEPAEVTGLADGDALPFEGGQMRVVHTPGHTSGSICLLGTGVLFSGDHVLQEISPNIGGGDLRSRGMLGQFMASLDAISQVGDDVIVHPGHGECFTKIGQRCQQLKGHHEERLQQVLGILSGGSLSVYEVALRLFGDMAGIHLVLGCAEANAHLELLAERGHAVNANGRWQLAN